MVAPEAAAAAAAMAAALAKLSAALPRTPPLLQDHAGTVAYRRAGERLSDAVAYYAPPRVLPDLWARAAVEAGNALAARGHHTLAAAALLAPAAAAFPLPAPTPGAAAPPSSASPSGQKSPDLELTVRAHLGLAACRASAMLARDPRVLQSGTLTALLAQLEALHAVAIAAAPHEALYHVVHDTTVAIADVARALVDAGLAGAALPALVFAAKAAGTHLSLAAPRHLAWRTRLYAMAAHCYRDALLVSSTGRPAVAAPISSSAASGDKPAVKAAAAVAATSASDGDASSSVLRPSVTAAQARAFLEDGARWVEHLTELTSLDAVPPDPAVAAAHAAAHAELLALGLLVPQAAGSPAAAAGAIPEGQQQQQQVALRELLAGLPSDAARLRVLASLLASAVSAGGASPLEREPGGAPPEVKAALEEAARMVAPDLIALAAMLPGGGGVTPRGEPSPSPPPTARAGTASAARRASIAVKGGAATATSRPSTAKVAAEAPSALAGDQTGDKQASAADVAAAAGEAARRLPLELHETLVCAAYRYSQQQLFGDLLAAAKGRELLSPRPTGRSSIAYATAAQGTTAKLGATTPGSLAGTTVLFEAAAALETANAGGGATVGPTRHAAIESLASTLVSHASALAPGRMRGLVAAAAMALHGAASEAGLLRTGFCGADARADATLHVLRALHLSFEAIALEDGLLRASVAVHLGLLLEERGELQDARAAALTAVETVEAARAEAAGLRRGRGDEHLLWISGSRTQLDEAAAAAYAGMAASDQDLACLHTDALTLHFRLELVVGSQEAAATATTRRRALLAAAARRDAQSPVFGARTIKQRRDDEAAAERAGQPPPNPVVKERELRKACGTNLYHRALLLVQMAALQQNDTARRAALLMEAGDALEEAQAAETALLGVMQSALTAAAAGGTRGAFAAPKVPKILQRGPCFVELSHFALTGKGLKQPAACAVFCKPVGAGVGLSINRTAMEYPGTGERVAIGGRLRVEGLKANEDHVFAVAAYDAEGNVIGELGASTPPVLSALPLPLPLCWATLLQAAARLECWTAATRAAAQLMPCFIAAAPPRPVWEAHPMDALTLRTDVASAAPPALLRAFAQAAMAYVARPRSQQQPAAASAAAARRSKAVLLELREPRVEGQLSLLRDVKRLLIAMEAAAAIGDEALVEEAATAAHDVLAPLLARRQLIPLLRQPLAALHVGLSGVAGMRAAQLAGEDTRRVAAARAYIAASHALLRLVAGAEAGAGADGVGDCSSGSSGTDAAEGTASLCRRLGGLDAQLTQVLEPAQAAGGLPAIDAADGSSQQAAAQTGGSGSQQKGGRAGKAASPTKGKSRAASPAKGARGAVSAGAATVGLDGAACTAGQQEAQLAATESTAGKADGAAELALAREAAVALTSQQGSAAVPPPTQGTTDAATDLAALIAPKLNDPDPLGSCWPLLIAEGASNHPRWLQLGVAVLEAAARRGRDARRDPRLHEAAEHLLQQACLAARVPQLLEWERWSLSAAVQAAETPAVQRLPSSTARTATVDTVSQQQMAEATEERRRVAAAMLLQRRLPVLLRRLQYIRRTRAQVAAAGPWLAKLHLLLGHVHAEDAREQLQVAEAAGGAGAPVSANTTGQAAPAVVAADKPAAAPATGSGAKKGPAGKASGGAAAKAGHGGQKGAAAAAEAAEAAQNAAAAEPPLSPAAQARGAATAAAADALRCFSRSVVLGSRSGPEGPGWSVALNGARAFWDAGRPLLNALPELIAAAQDVLQQTGGLSGTTAPAGTASNGAAWEPLALPPPRCPPLGLAGCQPAGTTEATAAGATGAAAPKAGKAAADKKPQAAAGGGAKGGKVAAAAVLDMRLVPQPVPRRPRTCAAPAAAAAAEALLGMVQALRAGAPYQPAVRLGGPSSAAEQRTKDTQPSTDQGQQQPQQATWHQPQPPECSFSLGSDAPTVVWYRGAPLDVPAAGRAVRAMLAVLRHAGCWHAVMNTGRRWLEITDGEGSEEILPFLLEAAPHVGADPAPVVAAIEAVARDKNQAIASLDRVRRLARECLGDVPLLAQGPAAHRRRPGGASLLRPRLVGTHQQHGGGGGDVESVFSAATHTAPGLLMRQATGVSVASFSGGGPLPPLQQPSLGGGLLPALRPQPSLAARSSVASFSMFGGRSIAASQPDRVKLPAEYQKVVEALKEREELPAVCLALNELGDIYAHFGMWSEAAVAWGDALDTLLGPFQVISCWRNALSNQPAPQLLRTYGAHGLLLAGGVLCGKLVSYHLQSDLGRQASAARLAAQLLSALLSCDLSHPQRPVDLGTHAPEEIWPGADLFGGGSPYRCCVPDLASGLEAVINVLLDCDLALEALPVIVIWEHVVRHVTRDAAATAMARAARVRALCALGMLGDAAAVLLGLVAARNLPDGPAPWPRAVLPLEGDASAAGGGAGSHKGGGSSSGGGKAGGGQHHGHHGQQQQAGATASMDLALLRSALTYDASAWPGAPQNRRCCECLSAPVLHPAVVAAYGPAVTAAVDRARASWLMTAGGVRNAWRQSDPATGLAAAPAPTGGGKEAAPAKGAAAAAKLEQQQAAQVTATGAAEPHKCATVEEGLLDAAAAILRASSSAATEALKSCLSEPSGPAGASVSGQSDAASRPKSSPRRPVSARAAAAADAERSPQSSRSRASAREGTDGGASKLPDAATAGKGGAAEQAKRGFAAAQHCHAAVRALLMLSEAEALRWAPAAGLEAALNAARLLREHSGPAAAALAVSGCGDDAQRYAIGPRLWTAARLQAVRCLQQMEHHAVALQQSEAAALDCASVNDDLCAAELTHLAAGSHAALGHSAAALDAYQDAAARYAVAHVEGGDKAWRLALDAAAAQQRWGLGIEAAADSAVALELLERQMHQLGLAEMLEHPETLAISLAGSQDYIKALLTSACNAMRRRGFPEAEATLRCAATLLPRTRTPPPLHAAVWVALARVLRATAAAGLPGSPAVTAAGRTEAVAARIRRGSADNRFSHAAASAAGRLIAGPQLRAARLTEAQEHLARAVGILARDAAFKNGLLHGCLLELAACCIDAGAPARAAAALQLAASAAAKHTALLADAPRLAPPGGAAQGALPAWLTDELAGQEAAVAMAMRGQRAHVDAACKGKTGGGTAAALQQQQASSAAATADEPGLVMGRLAVSHFAWLQSEQVGLGGGADAARREAQLLAMAPPLRAAFPKLASDCGWPDIPLPPADCPAPAAGSFVAQWYHGSCWQQAPRSKQAGAFGSSQNTALGTGLPKDAPSEVITLLFVAGPSSGSKGTASSGGAGTTGPTGQQQTTVSAGEVVFELSAVRALHHQVQDLYLRLTSPGAPSDIFKRPAPTEAELAAAKHTAERLLAGGGPTRDAAPPPDRLPTPPAAVVGPGAADAAAATGASAKPMAAGAQQGLQAPKPSGVWAGAAVGAAKDQQQQKDGAAAAPSLDWRTPATWGKVSALLNPNRGLVAANDPAFASWALSHLAKRAAG